MKTHYPLTAPRNSLHKKNQSCWQSSTPTRNQPDLLLEMWTSISMLYGDCIAHNNSPYSESNSSGHRSNASCIQAWTLQVDSPRLFPGIDLHMEAKECELLEVGTHPPVPILKVRTNTVVQISMQCYRGVSQKEGTSSIPWALPPWSSLTTSGTLPTSPESASWKCKWIWGEPQNILSNS